MALTKFDHYHTRHLNQFFLDMVDKPFAFGTWDCCLFSADAVLAFTGVDIASEFRGQYATQLGALKTIKSITGGTTVADAAAYCASKHGLEEHKYPLMCKRGDLVVFDNNGELISGIVHLSGRHVVSVSETGLVLLPITTVKRSWSV